MSPGEANAVAAHPTAVASPRRGQAGAAGAAWQWWRQRAQLPSPLVPRFGDPLEGGREKRKGCSSEMVKKR